MKLTSSLITLLTFCSVSQVMAMPSKAMIIFSGTPSKEFKKVLKSTLPHTLPEYKDLTRFETDNPTCKRRKGYLIQFCINGDQLKVVHQDKKALERTLSRLVNL